MRNQINRNWNPIQHPPNCWRSFSCHFRRSHHLNTGNHRTWAWSPQSDSVNKDWCCYWKGRRFFSVSYTFACSYEAKDSKHYLRCSTPSSQVLVGSYKLKSMNGDKEDFAVAKVQSVVLQYKEEKYPIASPTGEERRQLLSRKISIEFTLVSENEEMPKMYIVLKEEKYPLQGMMFPNIRKSLRKRALLRDIIRDLRSCCSETIPI